MPELSCNDPAALSTVHRQEAHVEAQVQLPRRRELMLAICGAVQALVTYETKHGREVARLLGESEKYAQLATAQTTKNAA